jgi:hypothetical protein
MVIVWNVEVISNKFNIKYVLVVRPSQKYELILPSYNINNTRSVWLDICARKEDFMSSAQKYLLIYFLKSDCFNYLGSEI